LTINKITFLASLVFCLPGLTSAAELGHAAPARIVQDGNAWTLENDVLRAGVAFWQGSIRMTSFYNRQARVEYLESQAKGTVPFSATLENRDSPPPPLFQHVLNGSAVRADDGGWTLSAARTSDIRLYGICWGKRLEVTLSRKSPVPFATRQIWEIYNGRAGLRYYSFVKNDTDRELTINASDVTALELPHAAHKLYYVEGILTWKVTDGGLTHGGRNGIVRYDSGDGWFAIPENNWSTSLTPGSYQGQWREKLLWLNIWNGGPAVRVATNPKAVQLVLFPREEVEYFSVDLGVFQGDDWDGRLAVSEHFRKRFKYHDTTHVLSTNDYRWMGQRTDKDYRQIAIPRAAAAGFDRMDIDCDWYTEDGCDAINNWTDLAALSREVEAHGMKLGHWFPLQGKGCGQCWGNGRDCADPANIDFKLKQTLEILVGKYHSAWGQLDCGLLWKNDKVTSFSHPSDSVYRKLLGMRRYINAVTHSSPDYIMHVTCEIDNPGGNSGTCQNIGLAHLGDNGIIGMYRRTESGDDVRDVLGSVGLFPPEGLLSTPGEGDERQISWADSPLWYYQFLLARHTSIYSWPGSWSPESIAHLRMFNDWRKNPRFKAVLDELLRPVYNGEDRLKNEGPWVWMFTDQRRTKALVFALNHLPLSQSNVFSANLRWLDSAKTYLVEDITMVPGGRFAYRFRGQFTGAELKSPGLAMDLDATPEPCAAFWIQEKTSDAPQVLYADAVTTSYAPTLARSASEGKTHTPSLALRASVRLEGRAGATTRLVVYKPLARGVENRDVLFDAAGRATAVFDATTISEKAWTPPPLLPVPAAATFAARDTRSGGAWRGKYGAVAAWFPHGPTGPQNGYQLKVRYAVPYKWCVDEKSPVVLELPPGAAHKRYAACWTAQHSFTLSVTPPGTGPYRLTVYLMDYDIHDARALEAIVKARGGKVLDSRPATIEEAAKGIYFTWTVSGPVDLVIRKTRGVNAAASGVFIDKGV
jgi:hypothetical protein